MYLYIDMIYNMDYINWICLTKLRKFYNYHMVKFLNEKYKFTNTNFIANQHFLIYLQSIQTQLSINGIINEKKKINLKNLKGNTANFSQN